MDIRLIKAPSPGTIKILKKRIDRKDIDLDRIGAIGLVQGKVIEMLVASDIAEKAVGVKTADIRGNCPQIMLTLGIFGSVASVEEALAQVEADLKGGKV